MKTDAFLAIGTNMGDRDGNIINCLGYISNIKNTNIKAFSHIYETEPVGYKDQGPFLNMVVCVETLLRPHELFMETVNIESRMKRVREIHWGPRVIDIDFLLYDDLKLESYDLTLPHPQMLKRAFVLVPLKEILHGRLYAGDIDLIIAQCDDRNGIMPYGEVVSDCGGGGDIGIGFGSGIHIKRL